jgi:RNA polymerase sigma-70 factor (ECF subfamily)
LLLGGEGVDVCIDDVILARKGNKEAFVRLIKSSETSMYRVAKSIVRADAECADAIQEAILRAYKSISSLKNAEYFKTWLIRILINECNRLMKERNKVVLLEKVKDHGHPSTVQERLEIQEAIEALDDDLRVIVTLFYIEDMPQNDISELLGIPEGTVKSRLHRAREKLSVLLNKNDERRSFGYES